MSRHFHLLLVLTATLIGSQAIYAANYQSEPTRAYLAKLREQIPLKEFQSISQSYVQAVSETKATAKKSLLLPTFKKVQILSAINDTEHWATVLVERAREADLQDPDTSILLQHSLRNIATWANTVSYHLANAAASSGTKKIQASWIIAENLRAKLNQLMKAHQP